MSWRSVEDSGITPQPGQAETHDALPTAVR
jgi:hypothetical protein